MSEFYSFNMNDITGDPVDFSRYEDAVCLIVNVASECGYTPQYAGLQRLYEKYRGDGLRVLGFPCNQFADEEPGDESEIREFCSRKYGVEFDMFSKIRVKGSDQAPLYEWLTSEENPWGPHRVRWNFQKYLLDESGEIVATFDPLVKPTDDYFLNKFDSCLS